MNVITFRILVVTWFVSWAAGIASNLTNPAYQVSRSVVDLSNPLIYEVTSLVGLILHFVAFVALFALWPPARVLYFLDLVFMLIYVAVYGEGWGSNAAASLNQLFLMLSGALALLCIANPDGIFSRQR